MARKKQAGERQKVAAPVALSESAGPQAEVVVEPQQRESPVGRRVLVGHGGQRHDAVVVGEAPGLVVQLRDGRDSELFVRASEVRT